MVKRARAGGALTQKSPAEFFSTNKNIAGFDGPGKSLYTSVRELVENGLDAAEAAEVLPEISIRLVEHTQEALDQLRGIAARARLDESLYTAAATATTAAAAAADGANDDDDRRGKKLYYRITVRDNGTGMPHEAIPEMLGRVLSGTKYGVQQSRGKFGLGAKMALIWARMSTGLPLEITTATDPTKERSLCRLSIDIYKNCPEVLEHRRVPNPEGWRGTEISVVIEGRFTTHRATMMRYLRELAVITPHATMSFEFVPGYGSSGRAASERWPRSSEELPERPQLTRYHPSAVDLQTLRRLAEMNPRKKLRPFLASEFQRISTVLAGRFCTELGLDPDRPVQELEKNDWIRVHQLFHAAKFQRPSADVLSPVGEGNLRAGVLGLLLLGRTAAAGGADGPLVATHQGRPAVFEGHPFLVEAAVAVGGGGGTGTVAVHRYANRIPLLFEAASDVVTRAVGKLPWLHYRINPRQDQVSVFVSLVSTRIPFKGTGKEYIGADIEEVYDEVYRAIRACAQGLRGHMVARARSRAAAVRTHTLMVYGQQAAALHARLARRILEHTAPTDSADLQWLRRQHTGGALDEGPLTAALRQHVETRLALDSPEPEEGEEAGKE